jgi:hypothetical protein
MKIFFEINEIFSSRKNLDYNKMLPGTKYTTQIDNVK